MFATLPAALLLLAQLPIEAPSQPPSEVVQIAPAVQPLTTGSASEAPAPINVSEPPAEPFRATEPDPAAPLQPMAQPRVEAPASPAAAQPPQIATPPAEPAPDWSPAAAMGSADAQATPARLPTGGRRSLPPEMVAEALTLPTGGSITGRPVALLEVLSTTTDPRRLAEIARAYWRLSEAVAEYHFAFEENAAAMRFEARAEDQGMLRTAQVSAAAALESTELLVIEAQSGLAEAALLTFSDPLPADPPHVGPYRTHFDELFASRTSPAHVWRIDRTLPIRRRAIDARATAVHAAEDNLEAVADAYRQGRLPFSAVLSAMGQLGRQRRAMIASVGQYNDDIADYATTVVAPGTPISTLVGMLIRPKGAGSEPAANRAAGLTPASRRPAIRSDVQPAMHLEPVPEGQLARPPLRPGQPTLAPPRPESPATQPTPAPPRSEVESRPSQAPEPAAPSQTPVPEPPREVPPAESPVPRPVVPLSSLPPATPRTAMRPGEDSDHAATSAVYPALLDMDPAMRAKQLAVTLHWNRSLPEHGTEPIALADALKMAAVGQRARAVAAYWQARQAAAEYQVFGQAVELFEELSLAALDRREDAAGAAAMLQARACKVEGEAERLEAELELLAAEYELTETLGRPLQGRWLLPTTAPHSGPYLLKLDAQPPQLVATRPMQRLAKAVPSLAEGLKQRAAAVVQADAVRATIAAEYRNGGRAMDEALSCVQQQTDQTLAFLETLTTYNEAIAEYALAVLPANAPAEVIAQTLVVEPETGSAAPFGP